MLEDDNTDITVGEFVEMLWTECRGGSGTACGADSECRAGIECGGAAPDEGSSASLTQRELLRYGHFRGWLEDSDERHPENLLNRQTAARIIHQFMVVELHMSDVADISAAEKLRDLYTCRVCANHIAQVYARGIMGAEEVLSGDAAATQSILIFTHLGRMSYREVQKIISSIKKAML